MSIPKVPSSRPSIPIVGPGEVQPTPLEAAPAPPATADAGDRFVGEGAAATAAAPARDPQADAVAIRESRTRRSRTRSIGDRIDRATDKLKEKVVELGWKELTKRHEVGERFSLAEGTSLGLRLEERIYRPTDPAIVKDPVRKATTDALEAGGKKVLWAETGGVIELGTGVGGTLPLGGGVTGSAGLSGSGILRYRTTQPYPLGLRQTPEDLLKNNTVRLPLSADTARAMPGGAEFEIMGRGTVAGSASAGVGAETGFGPVTAGASARIGGSGSGSAELSVNVRRLDGDRVRVTVSDIDRKAAGASAELRAGLKLDGDQVFPDIGEGRIAALAEEQGAKGLEKLVKKYTSFSARAGVNRSDTDRVISSYVLDLSKPGAAKAYDRLMRLDASEADTLSNRPDSGVSVATLDEARTDKSRDASIHFFGKKLLLYKALKTEREGELTRSEGQPLVYRESKFDKRYSGFITGDKHISWEGVTARAGEGGPPSTYFRMRFDGQDKVTRDAEIRDFFSYARSLGIEESGEMRRQPPDMLGIAKIFSGKDDTRVRSDVYFTRDGIGNIAEAGQEKALGAYLSTAAEFDDKLRGTPFMDPQLGPETREIANKYRELQREADFAGGEDRHDLDWEMMDLRRRYRRLTGRKTLTADARALDKAQSFADSVDKLGAAGDDEEWNNLFAKLGKSQGFDYMRTVASMAKLAGKDETLVHELSMTGEGIRLKSTDEGAIEHPDAEVVRALNRDR